MQQTEMARAKVNLILRVLGKRPDGYHELDSLVAFADVGDRLTLEAAKNDEIVVEGPFAAALTGHDNLVQSALDVARSAIGTTQKFKISLVKHLPVAAGIGGGSADAAAVLRVLQRLHPDAAVDWAAVALSLGADVPVCLHNMAVRMQGVGERVTDLVGFLPLAAVLVNPLAPVPANKTTAIFSHLNAGPLRAVHAAVSLPLDEEIAAGRNDLQSAARSVMPAIVDVLSALEAAPGRRFVRLSGAGPTCFGVFISAATAKRAAENISTEHPDWWVKPTVLR